MTEAEILAIGGITASTLTMLSGPLQKYRGVLLGVGGAVMLLANLIVLAF